MVRIVHPDGWLHTGIDCPKCRAEMTELVGWEGYAKICSLEILPEVLEMWHQDRKVGRARALRHGEIGSHY